MDELEHLTDNELRARLVQYGFPNMPITTTTRKTLLKKLRLYLQNAGLSLQKSKDRVTKYSSDEDSSTRSAGNERSKNQRLKKTSIQTTQISPIKNNSKPYSTKNIYVSPVYINSDSDEEEERSFTGSKSYRHSSADEMDSTSKFTKRLLQLRRDNIQNTQHRTSTIKKRENGGFAEQREIKLGIDSPVSSLLAVPKKQESNKFHAQHSLVSMVLMGFPIIFFTLLIIAYLNMSFNIENTMHQSSAAFAVCESENITKDCIEEANIESSLKLLKSIASRLREKSRNLTCGKQKQATDIVVVCKTDLESLKSNEDEITKNFNNIKYLIEHNPAWGITNTYQDCFSLSTHSSSMFCTVYEKLQKFFIIIGTLALLGIAFLSLRKFYYFILDLKEKRRAQVRVIINEILSLLIEKTNEDKQNPFLSVDYMREKILGENKLFMSSAWLEALTYLEQNEKRLAFGYENINGEDLKVIRWLESIDSSIINQPKHLTDRNIGESEHLNLKKWLGPAFDKCNKIVSPPTNCLKIRQMFDKYEINNENLQTCIQDTILMKVQGKGCKIIDVKLDKKTCCVYIKCATCADAGIVHTEINGWWLDQRLVVVKFLKEEKYDQRFPNAGNGTFLKLSQLSRYYTSLNEGRDSDIDF